MTDAQDRVWSDSMPATYDRCLGPALFTPMAQDLAARASGIGGTAVLELAAGTGLLTRELVAALPGSQVTATDLNEAMVAYGRGAVPEADWRQADAQQLAFPDLTFDLVTCQYGVMFFPDRVAAYREARRVLRPGGTFLISTWDDLEHNSFAAGLATAVERVLPHDPPSFITRIPHGYSDPAQVTSDLRSAGFSDVELVTVRSEGSTDAAATLAEGWGLGSPLRAALAERGDLHALVEALKIAMTDVLGAGPLTGELQAHVLQAR
jgi:SAM-dependent methyltransferase